MGFGVFYYKVMLVSVPASLSQAPSRRKEAGSLLLRTWEAGLALGVGTELRPPAQPKGGPRQSWPKCHPQPCPLP